VWGGVSRIFSCFVAPEFLFPSFKQPATGPLSKPLQLSPQSHIYLLKEHIHISFILMFRSPGSFLANFVCVYIYIYIYPIISLSFFLILLKYVHNTDINMQTKRAHKEAQNMQPQEQSTSLGPQYAVTRTVHVIRLTICSHKNSPLHKARNMQSQETSTS